MKRYIRTQDGHIIDVGVFIENRDGECHLHWTDDMMKGGGHVIYNATPFVKEADTIEELVDVYVAIYKEDPYDGKPISEPSIIYLPIMERYSYLYTGDETIKTIFGAIWTDKGIIYVAKRNEEGRLELL